MKNDVIYCFTGTGNSLFIANQIARVSGSKIIMINKELLHDKLFTKYDRVGIVFPVYHQGIPVMVADFLRKLSDVEIDYLYAVSTYGDKPTLALKYVEDIFKNKKSKLANGFAIRMPYNYLRPRKIGKGMYDSFVVSIPNKEKCDHLFGEAEKKLEYIIESIFNRASGDLDISDYVIENIVDKLNLRDTLQKRQWLKVAGYKGEVPDTFSQAIALMDHKFSVASDCTFCGICSLICPAENIIYINDIPVWKHQCEQCMACLHWCSKGAINYGQNSEAPTQYHHPEITIDEIIKRGKHECSY